MKLLKSDYNHVSGITTEYWLRNDGNIQVRGVQDVDPILATNRDVLNTKSSKSSKLNEAEGLGTKVASIPTILVEKLLKEKGLNLYTCSDKELKSLLNDSDYSKLRTAHGRV